MNLNAKILNGAIISSSGTTGDPKKVYRSPENIRACSDLLFLEALMDPKFNIPFENLKPLDLVSLLILFSFSV